MKQSIRVLMIDDSQLFLDLMRAVILTDDELEVCGTATTAHGVAELVELLRPDVVTMDLHMPGGDGLAAVEAIHATRPTPILVMTADPAGKDGSLCVAALARGALDVVAKPDLSSLARQRVLCERIKGIARRQPGSALQGRPQVAQTSKPATARPVERRPAERRPAEVVVAIGASTGGPPALARTLGALPASFRAGIVIVQHLAGGFTHHLAHWLADLTPLEVRVAVDGEPIIQGTVLVAPDGAHLRLRQAGALVVAVVDRTTPAIGGHRPAADALLGSVAALRAAGIGVVLSGMGKDGAAGMAAVRAAGGACVVQEFSTCVVDSMPRAASGELSVALPPEGIARFLIDEVARRTRAA